MKKEKKLKLDTLSSNELSSKEATQISGGIICYCYCTCDTIDDRAYSRIDDRVFLRTEPIL